MTGSPRPFSGLGFALGSVRGVRTFRYLNRIEDWSELGTPGQLMGLYYPQAWVDGVNIAQCRKKDTEFNYFAKRAYEDYELGRVDREPIPPHTFDPVPQDGEHLPACNCGFYAYYDGSNDYYDPEKHGPDLITGVMEGWGEVLIGARGFRCTRARIVALCIPEKHASREMILAHYPSVPNFVSFDRMVEVFPEEDGGARAEYREAQERALAAKMIREAETRAITSLETDGGPVI